MQTEQEKRAFLKTLKAIVGRRNCLTGKTATKQFRTGWRYGSGDAFAVIRPRSLVELWKVLQEAVARDCIIIMQAANTGLTGGSTPNGHYDRPVLLINTMQLNKIYPIRDGQQVICLPGARLNELEQSLDCYEREPHSVIGSSCIGASVMGGVCNNSGGALVRRGPVYTEMSLFAQLNADGQLELINHLGFKCSDEPERLLDRLDLGVLDDSDFESLDTAKASADDYDAIVRDVDADTPARYNADPRRLHEASGCAGKLAVFAVRLDTFQKPVEPKMIYIGAKDPTALSLFRQRCLKDLGALPISAEYMDESAYRIAKSYGKDNFLAIRSLGDRHIPKLFSTKAKFDAFLTRVWGGFAHVSDRILQALGVLFPAHLPKFMDQFHREYSHHLLFKIETEHTEEVTTILDGIFEAHAGEYHICSDSEARSATLHRFVAAGASMRLSALKGKKAGGIVAIDVALPRNCEAWSLKFPPEILDQIEQSMSYGHFFCHVFHLDFVVEAGVEPHTFENEVLQFLKEMGAEYPAEHNVGHIYEAKTELAKFYKSLDPTNSFNPGIGKTTKTINWKNSH